MKVVFDVYNPDETIPTTKYLKNRKLIKYFNRETAAAIVCVGKLLAGIALPPDTPFYYATGLLEYEEYGLSHIVEAGTNSEGKFSDRLFMEQGAPRISPLMSFKVLQNMPLAFVSIAYHLTGDNAVVCVSAASLLQCVLYAPTAGPILIGAGKVHQTGRTESGFALIKREDIAGASFLFSPAEAIELFWAWSQEQGEKWNVL